MSIKFKKMGGFDIASRQFLAVVAIALAGVAMATFTPDAMAAGGTGSTIAIPSSGKSIGDISANITTSLAGAGVMVTALAYLGALAFGFMGALKWKAYGEQPDRTPLKVPVTYMAIAAILAALPEFLGTGISTLWGSGASVVTAP